MTSNKFNFQSASSQDDSTYSKTKLVIGIIAISLLAAIAIAGMSVGVDSNASQREGVRDNSSLEAESNQSATVNELDKQMNDNESITEKGKESSSSNQTSIDLDVKSDGVVNSSVRSHSSSSDSTETKARINTNDENASVKINGEEAQLDNRGRLNREFHDENGGEFDIDFESSGTSEGGSNSSSVEIDISQQGGN